MKIFLLIFFLTAFKFLHAQEADNLLAEATLLESSMHDEEALLKYREILRLQSGNIFAICKASELSSRIGARFKDDKDKQASFYAAAKGFAMAALKRDPLNSDANFVMALVMGREAMERGGKEKIAAVKDIKFYAERSVRYNPANYKAWFILGKWYYEVSALNYFQKTAVKLFFGALPDGTINDAIRCLEKSKSLNPGFVLSYLSLAKAYEKKEDNERAKQNLSVMISLPDTMQDDPQFKMEGRELLKKLN